MGAAKIRFNMKDRPEFFAELRKRVNNYFEENNISRYGNAKMVIKTIFMISLYFVPYTLVLLNTFTNPWAVLGLWVTMGVGMAGIGLSIMHDANHSAYSKNKYVNMIMGKLIWLVGGSDVNWRIQHNVLHHTYTNVTGMDEDIEIDPLMRFSPAQRLLKGHHKAF